MIAILSGTYEDQTREQLTRYLMELGKDALEKPYQPHLHKPPWMPRPWNLLNVAIFMVFWVLGTALWLLVPARYAGPPGALQAKVDRIHWRVHMFAFWLFGNVMLALFVLLLVICWGVTFSKVRTAAVKATTTTSSPATTGEAM